MRVRLYCTRSPGGEEEGQCARACVLMHETVKSDPLFKPHPGAGRPLQFMHIYTHTHTHAYSHIHSQTYRAIHASHVKLKQAPYCGFVLKPVLTIRVFTLACMSVCLCVCASARVCVRISNANLLRSDFPCIFAVPVVCSCCCCPCCTVLAAFAGFGLFIRFALKRRT